MTLRGAAEASPTARKNVMISALRLPRGPLMIDIGGTELTTDDRRRLSHPLVGGLILFARNYVSPEQLQALTAEVRKPRSPSKQSWLERMITSVKDKVKPP